MAAATDGVESPLRWRWPASPIACRAHCSPRVAPPTQLATRGRLGRIRRAIRLPGSRGTSIVRPSRRSGKPPCDAVALSRCDWPMNCAADPARNRRPARRHQPICPTAASACSRAVWRPAAARPRPPAAVPAQPHGPAPVATARRVRVAVPAAQRPPAQPPQIRHQRAPWMPCITHEPGTGAAGKCDQQGSHAGRIGHRDRVVAPDVHAEGDTDRREQLQCHAADLRDPPLLA